jgi:hypothetical protein
VTKKIHPIDQQIISLLENGLSTAQISFEMERRGEDVMAAYVRRVKMLIEANMTDLLETEEEIHPRECLSTSRQYVAYREKHSKQ